MPALPVEDFSMNYEKIEWTYSKAGSGLPDTTKNRLRQLGMSPNGIAELSTGKSVSIQKDMQIVTMLVTKALG